MRPNLVQAEREGLLSSRKELHEMHKENTYRSEYGDRQEYDSGHRSIQREAFCRRRLQRENQRLQEQLMGARRQLDSVLGSVRRRVSDVEESLVERYAAVQVARAVLCRVP